MVKIFDLESDQFIVDLTDEEFAALAEALEEDSIGDVDYYLHVTDVEFIEEQGTSVSLIAKLKAMLEGREDREIRFQRM
ncbi:MAG: hypothetical protein A2W93_13945 [Bacteroidetes bacterium GWF2_43_63]|nr:MAG: hypothetical protein A2W94_00515 [Bacteroidetes bacterium GWE2_42_42]OFY52450.1 MAG: hypothetical protein A2W93_13945 [Bacteroidetes bacterium GWF2_43_63]HBG71356.1 hypothetical protein [Bacteroidales bacterium]HCB60894.1 hypothetical protein [Bacteroidales bacterium]HCY23931.1 hypothetical protein [Bacteroidales bacterium]